MYLTAQLCNARDRNYIVYAKRRGKQKEEDRKIKDKSEAFC